MIAITLIGPSGSGKTKLGRAVSTALDIEYVGSGDVARDIARADYATRTELDRGAMAPELAMRAEIKHRVEAAVLTTGDFVIDGFPRTVEQLYILESVPNIKPLYFVLDVPQLLCFRRLIKRGREDDHPDAVATRLRTYIDQTMPMIDVLWGWDLRLKMDGSLSPDVLVRQVIDGYHSAKRELDSDAIDTVLD